MRSNYIVAIPSQAIGVPPTGDLEASALFVKGRKAHSDGSASDFHPSSPRRASKGSATTGIPPKCGGIIYEEW